MSTISLTHEGNISIEHLASMSTNAMVVDMVVTAKRSQRIENAKRDHRRSERAIHRGGACKERWCCPKGTKPQRPTNHELSLVALWADFDGQFPFRVTVAQTAPKALDMLLGKEMAAPKVMPSESARCGFIGGYTATPSEIRSMQREAIAEGRWFPETVVEDDVDINPFARQDIQERAAAYRAKLDRQNARRKERAAQREIERREAQRQHWAKVYQRPEADARAKTLLKEAATLSTATK